MALMRRSTENQLKKIRSIVKKSGGDIADRVSKDEKKFPNLYYMRNPSDIKIDTYEDNYSIGNVTKLKENKKQTKYMKNLRTFEQHDLWSTIKKMLDNKSITEEDACEIIDSQKMPDIFKNAIKKEISLYLRKDKIESLDEAYYDFPQGVEQIPEFYFRQWLDFYTKWCEENKLLPEYEDIESLRGDEDAISHVFYHAEIYAKEHKIFLDGKEFIDQSYFKQPEIDEAYSFSKGDTIKLKSRDNEEEVEVVDNFDSNVDTHIELIKGDGTKIKITREKLKHLLIESKNFEKNIDILRVGKGLDLGDIKGIVNKIEGKFVYIEVGMETVKVPMIEVFKKYKKFNDRGLKISNA